MKILVTGGAGFIGSAFVRLLIAETDWHVVNLDKLTYAGNLENLARVDAGPRYRFVHGDICDAALVDSLVAAEKPDAVLITGDISDIKSGPWRARSNFPAWFWPSRWVTRGH